ncbi:MAG TPA: YihY/virulence factor BrkB family protein [Euzebyales bacterium]|nr:YihY/virulence factor BrkB family protein [Euzebyales bacterium]
MSSRFDLRALRDRDEVTAAGKELTAEIKSDDVPTLAAAVSFKIVLALFPALLAAVAISALVIDERDLTQLLANAPPDLTEAIRPQLEEFIERAASGGIAIGGIALGLWAASGAASTLNKALSRAYDEADDRKLLSARGIALVVTVALLVALIAISVLLVAGGAIENRILTSLPLTETAQSGLDLAATVGRYVAAVLLLMVLFAFIYWIGPDWEQRPRWAWITPGAALAVVTWLLASAVFGWYVATFGSYTKSNSPYGPLGSAIVFMLWLQLSMFALLLGAEVNQVLTRRARRRRSGVDADAGAVGAAHDGHRAAVATSTAATATVAAFAGGGIRAATTPTRGRAGVARSRPPAGHTNHSGATADPSPGGPRHDHVIDSHAPDGHGGGGSAGTQRSVPTATLLGAGVAAVSSLVGLTGLLRRLKG